MSVARRWVFPILGLVVAAAIAVALIKLAFFGTSGAGAGGEEPTGGFVDPQVPVMISTVSNDVVLSGTVKADDAVPVKAPLDGTLTSVDVGVGSVVAAGQQIGVVKGVNSAGKTVTVGIGAPVAGTISALSIVPNQQTQAGTVVAQIAPPGFYVTASVQPADRYRLLEAPAEAQVTVTGGPAPFTCTNLTITTPLAGAGTGGTGDDPGTGDPGAGAGSGTTARCVVPADVTVFPDLVAQLTISAGVAENVLVVPVTAVLGAAESGVVYVVDPETGETEERPVTLGLSDGINVEVVDGLTEGELVMQFVPGAPAQDPNMPGGPVIYGMAR
jgi:macrolide-specific efflux system membrane fusion protein